MSDPHHTAASDHTHTDCCESTVRRGYSYTSVDDALSTESTRTLTIRKQYAQWLRGRLSAIRAALRRGIVEYDAFDLLAASHGTKTGTGTGTTTPTDALVDAPAGWDFPSNSDKERAFNTWVDNQLDEEILDPNRRRNPHLGRAYERGVKESNTKLRRAGVVEVADDASVEAILRRPAHRETLETVYTRNYRQLEGFTSAIGQDTGRVISNGLAAGHGPREIARDLADVIGRVENGVPRGHHNRATVIARTETMNAFHQSTAERFAEFGVERAEVVVAEDERTCQQCLDLEKGNPYPVSELRGILPLHPQCRCSFIPVVE